MNTLHILNGDATYYVFKQTDIPGDVLVWREILSEGPVSSSGLWTVRSAWITETFGGTISDYQQGVVLAAEKLHHLDAYNEVMLWFEYDLVCQVNLIYILSVISNAYNNNQWISLICPKEVEGYPNFKGLGELDAIHLKQLLPTKTRLQKNDILLAKEAWDLYVENDPTKIRFFLTKDFGNLSLLKPALAAHLLRFPKTNQLNHIDEVLLALINAGVTSRPQLYEKFWEQEAIFGMGDLQINLALDQLAKRGLLTVKLSDH